MNGRTAILCIMPVLAVLIAIPTARADKDAKKPRELPRELRNMIEFLRCSPQQREKVAELLERHEKADKSLAAAGEQKQYQINTQKKLIREQIKSMEEKLKPLREQLKGLYAQENELRRERMNLKAVHGAELATMFTPEQRFAWQKHKMADKVRRRHWRAGLDETQKVRIAALAEAAVMEINSLDIKDREKKRREVNRIERKLYKAVYDDILTEAGRISVDAERMYWRVWRDFRRLRLSRKQQERIRAACRPQAAAVRKVPKEQRDIARKKAIAELKKKVVETILTDKQKQKLKSGK